MQQTHINAAQVHFGSLLSSDTINCPHCLDALVDRVKRATGIINVEIDNQAQTGVIHYDPAIQSLDSIETLVRDEGAAIDAKYVRCVLPIDGMDCADCATTLERGIQRMDGIERATINFAGAQMSVEYAQDTTSLTQISARIRELGYRVADDEHRAAERTGPAFVGFLVRRENLQTLLAAALLVLGIGLLIAPAPATTSTASFILAILIAGVPIARKAIITARASRQLDINMLMTIAVIGAAFLGEWLEAATVVVLFAIGEALEGFSMDRARRSIRSLMNLTPATATIRRDGQVVQIAAEKIAQGDLIILRPGERVPVDGKVVAGTSAINQAPVTGESIPVDKAVGADVFSGTVNGTGVLEVEATRRADDSTIARIIRMVEDAQAQRAPTQRFIDVFAKYYTPGVVLLAAMIALGPPVITGAAWSDWIYRALVLLVIACPCALVISTPVSIVSAISAAARNGVLIKGGAHLEAAGSLTALAFDKTGTLTIGVPRVTAIVPTEGIDETDLLGLAAAAERYSEHPLGQAIVREAEARNLSIPDSTSTGTHAPTGRGIEARVGDQTVRIGSQRYIEAANLNPELATALRTLEERGQTVVLISVDDRVLGLIGFADELRPGINATLRQLHDAGIKETMMLTGDQQRVAAAIASDAGISTIEAELLPEQKVEAIERLLERHRAVGMVGDGINDAPALARSTVGIAMGAAGSDAALETADIALMSDDLGKVGFVVRLSRATRRVIAQNVSLSLAIKAVFLVLAVAGSATLWQAVFADVGAALIVIANGMRLFRVGSD